MSEQSLTTRIALYSTMAATIAGAIALPGGEVHANESRALDANDIDQLLNDGGAILHAMDRGESLQTIARDYGLSVDDLMRHNPSLAENNTILEEGSTIVVPYEKVQEDTIFGTNQEPLLPNEQQESGNEYQQRIERYAGQAKEIGLHVLDTISLGFQDIQGNKQVPEAYLKPKIVEDKTEAPSDVPDIHIETNADGGYVIEVGPTDKNIKNSSQNTSEVPNIIANTEKSEPSRQTENQTTPELPIPKGSYREYLDNLSYPTEPESIVTLRDTISANDSNGLQIRSHEWQNKMDWLEQSVAPNLSADGFARFMKDGVDTSLADKDLFKSERPSKTMDSIHCSVEHWTGGNGTDIENLVLGTLGRPGSTNVQFYNLDGILYQVMPTYLDKANHAAGANECVGTENVAGDLLDISPEEVLTDVYKILMFHYKDGMELIRDVNANAPERNSYGDLVFLPDAAEEATVKTHNEIDNYKTEISTGKTDVTTMLGHFIFTNVIALKNQLEAYGTNLSYSPGSEINSQSAFMGGSIRQSPQGFETKPVMLVPNVITYEQSLLLDNTVAVEPIMEQNLASTDKTFLETSEFNSESSDTIQTGVFEVVDDWSNILRSANPNWTERQFDFATEVFSDFVDLANQGYRINPMVATTQAIVESNYGSSEIATNANNPLGMTTTRNDPDAFWHSDAGNMRPFKSFKTIKDALEFYAQRTTRAEHYADASACYYDIDAYISGLQNENSLDCLVIKPHGTSGVLSYAEADNYQSTLMNGVRNFGFDRIAVFQRISND